MRTLMVIVFLLCLPSAAATPADDHSRYTETAECLSCHPMAAPTHKRAEARKIPSGWPLGEGRRLLCTTCHDCKGGRCVLRRAGVDFCRACHDCTQGMACLIKSAHLGNSRNIEAELRDCVICHDGGVGTRVGGAGEHPVDILYLNRPGYSEMLDRRIILVGGKVTCLSCHDPYKNTKMRLVMSNEGSRLCLECHQK